MQFRNARPNYFVVDATEFVEVEFIFSNNHLSGSHRNIADKIVDTMWLFPYVVNFNRIDTFATTGCMCVHVFVIAYGLI